MFILLMCGEIWYCFGENISVDEQVSCINASLLQFITLYRYKNKFDNKSAYKKLAASMESPYFDTTTEKRRMLIWYCFGEDISVDEQVSCINASLLQFITLYRYKNKFDNKSAYKKLAASMESPYFDTTTEKRRMLTLTVNAAKTVNSLFFLGYNIFELYIICRWCDEIRVQSQNIGEAVYCCGWESGVSLLPGVKQSVKLVIARTQKSDLIYNKKITDKYFERMGNLVEQHNLILR
ncbi:Odorant receptor [Operophtera brumata]|uniref:Odorant receptor n=1 Tax=Operophtera brumata TaxID=104452 RepID=A0A0L7L2W7_OPEBR|nr:Odorant receptor [Operophtera brumata]